MSYAEAAEREGEVTTLNDYEHIYESADMYLGPMVQASSMMWTVDEELTPKMVVTLVPLGLIQLFSEVLANACDAMEKTVRNGFEIGPVEVEFQNPYIIVRNQGFPILVRKDENEIWLPEKVVTAPRTGSNFGGHRHGGGKNGYGLKLLYAFSDYFRIVVHSSVDGWSYSQEFTGVGNISEPDLVPYEGEVSSVEITFKPTFWRFGYPSEIEAYPEEVEDIYRSHVAVASLACKTPAFFNGFEMDYTSIIEYSKLFFAPELKKKVHYIWPKNTKVITREDGSQVAKDGLTLPLVELIVVDSDASSEKSPVHFGITNSILNHEGGVHVDSVFKALAYRIIAHINGEGKPGKDEKKAVKNSFRINLGHIKLHLGVIISVHVLNPMFNGQSKTALRSYEDKRSPGKQLSDMELEIPNSFIDEIIAEFDFIRTLREMVQENMIKPLSALDGSKSLKCKDLFQGEDCNWSGGKHSQKCVLLIFEGKSAGAYGSNFRAEDPDGINSIGLLATGGKIKNISAITEETVDKLSKNKFFHDFKTMTNVRENTDYTDPQNRKHLRYGHILYAGDADVDGIHICSLFFNLINTLYPSLLEAGVVDTYRTKIISATPKAGKNRERRKKIFYQEADYRAWEQTVDISRWDMRRFKGLGSSGPKDVKEDYKEMFVVKSVYDEDADYFIRLFFLQNKEMAAKRRELIVAHNKNDVPPEIPLEVDGTRYENISDYLQYNYITYCAHTLVRHLMARDGLTDVRRKIIHAATVRWNWWSSVITTPLRVSVFNGAAIDITEYHHGESLTNVIIRMAQDFVGSNNIPSFIGEGQFGTRETGGNVHAAARYIAITPNYWWLRLMYNPKDAPLLTYKKEEGKNIEPEFFLPPLPLTLIEGQHALMSGWTVYIPPHNPLDLVDWYLQRLSGMLPDEIQEPRPFLRGFRGPVEITDSRKTQEVEENILDQEGQEVVNDYGDTEKTYVTVSSGKRTLNTYGTVTNIEGNCLTITELPYGVWTHSFLEKTIPRKIKEGKVKKAFKDTGYKPEAPVIRVEGIRSRHHQTNPGRINIDADDFPLRMSYSLESMWILDENEKAKYFETVTDILEDFYQWRLPYYEKRRQLELANAKLSVEDINDKVAYIQAVLSKELIIIKRKKADILEDIRRLQLKESLYGFTKYYDNESVAKLLARKEIVEEEYKRLEAMTAEDIMRDEILTVADEYKVVYGDDR